MHGNTKEKKKRKKTPLIFITDGIVLLRFLDLVALTFSIDIVDAIILINYIFPTKRRILTEVTPGWGYVLAQLVEGLR